MRSCAQVRTVDSVSVHRYENVFVDDAAGVDLLIVCLPVVFLNKCERVAGPKPEPFQSIFPGVNATRTSGTGLERDQNANRNRCEQGLSCEKVIEQRFGLVGNPRHSKERHLFDEMAH